MAENAKHQPITIDLNQFRLRIDLKKRIELTLHFNSPSRKFYLSLIAFIVNEMKELGKITSIPLEKNHDLLTLLNETIGGLPAHRKRRIYCQGSTGNGSKPFLTWKKPRFSKSSEGKRDMRKGLAKPIPLARLKKITGQIFLSTRGAKRMSGSSSP